MKAANRVLLVAIIATLVHIAVSCQWRFSLRPDPMASVQFGRVRLSAGIERRVWYSVAGVSVSWAD